MDTKIEVEVSVGELLDKITILQIKTERIKDEAKLKNVRAELNHLTNVQKRAVQFNSEIKSLFQKLKETNENLWEIEDEIRDHEKSKDFGPEFIHLARMVYMKNDLRCYIKRQLNEKLGSELKEEKSYTEYSFNA
jgi:uncharacterized damage-inducible protein DinB